MDSSPLTSKCERSGELSLKHLSLCVYGLYQVISSRNHSAALSSQGYCSTELPHTSRGEFLHLFNCLLQSCSFSLCSSSDDGPGLPLPDGKEFPGVWGAAQLWPRPMEQQPGGRPERGSDGVPLARVWVRGEAVCRQEDRREWDAAFADAREWQRGNQDKHRNQDDRKIKKKYNLNA